MLLWVITMTTAARLHPNQEVARTRSTLCADGRILSEQIARAIPAERRLRTNQSRVAETSVAEVMTSHVLCVSPDVEIGSLASLLVERGISGVPVVNERGLPVGMVSKTDIVRHLYENGETQAGDGATVGDLMLPIAFTLLEGASLAHAASLMAWEGVHRIPICSDAGDVIGIVSALDVVRWLSREEGYPVRTASAIAGPRTQER
jgi:CBS domain-containing protein